MNYILYDGHLRNQFLPLTFTRPVAEIRIGILTIREKWQHYLGGTITTLTEEYLSQKYPMVELDENIMINATFLPNDVLVEMICQLKENQLLVKDDEIIAFYTQSSQEEVDFSIYEWIDFNQECIQIKSVTDIFTKNAQALQEDFECLTKDRVSQKIPATVQVLGSENIFIEQGAVLNFVTLNAIQGPIYIGKNSEIMEGSLIRGPFALGEQAQVKMGAKIYGATTIGPHCRVGGEVNNSVLFGYTNKGHDGFLGNSVLGEWCNLGADTNNSNLKNNYHEVKLWNYESSNFASTGLQFCGLMMGDHSKSAINTMFNTGTVVGICSNVYGSGFPRNYLPNFSWGGVQNNQMYQLNKALETARIVMNRRNIELSKEDENILSYVFNQTSEWNSN